MTVVPVRAPLPRRIAMVSVHTSPLDQPGTGDAGGMNVYVVELSRRLAALGVQVDVITRATSSELPPAVELAPGVTVRHVTAGPFEGLAKEDLPAQLCAFTSGLLRIEAAREPGWYDVVHSHYWLSGQVAWLAAERWDVPLVHTMHTMAKVKNLTLAQDDAPEPVAREIGEAQVVAAADRLVANTDEEGKALIELYDADPARVATVPPGVDLERFRPGSQAAARGRLGLPGDASVLLFVGRIQPLKAPDVLLRAVARLLQARPSLRDELVVAVVGGLSGSGLTRPDSLHGLAHALGLADVVRVTAAVPQADLADWYRAADLTVVPSYSESFGLVAIESQACATPVVAAGVGGLRTAVRDGVSGVLVDGHDPADYARVLGELLADPGRRRAMSRGALAHSAGFSWTATATGMLEVYSEALAVREQQPLVVNR
jgi:D-inositol-3-phosphate glycosyltransferase